MSITFIICVCCVAPFSRIRHNQDEWRTMDQDGWRAHSRATLTKLRMPQVAQPWSPRARLHGVPRLARNRDVVDVSWWRWYLASSLSQKEALEVPAPKWYVDLRQGVQFAAGGATIPTLLQGSQIYCFEADALLTAKELSAVMGHPFSDAISDDKVGGLLGDVLHGAVLCSMFTPLIFADMPWTKSQSATSGISDHRHRKLQSPIPDAHKPPRPAPSSPRCDEVEAPNQERSGLLMSDSDSDDAKSSTSTSSSAASDNEEEHERKSRPQWPQMPQRQSLLVTRRCTSRFQKILWFLPIPTSSSCQRPSPRLSTQAQRLPILMARTSFFQAAKTCVCA